MRNVTGSPVENDDFFNRPRDLARLQRHLKNGTDALLTAPRAHLLNALMTSRPSTDAANVEEQLSRLLLMLQRDGYLLERGGRYTFRSFLLREYWHRREVR